MSRSVFAERLRELVGESPQQYLLRYRVHLATYWLRAGRLSVKEVTARVGYRSVASFSQQFKRRIGVGPAEHARRRQSQRGRDSATG